MMRLALPLWLAGTLVSLTVLAVRLSAFHRWLGRLRRVENRELQELAGRLAVRFRLRRQVRVCVVDGPVGPVVTGLVRPTVVLPAAILRGRPVDELAPLLAHELVHVRRGDLWWALLQSLARSLFWFHPLVGMATRRAALEAERCCDEETVAGLACRSGDYARMLLEILEYKHGLRVAPALPGVRPVDVTLVRLERIMKLRQGRPIHSSTPFWAWAVLAGTCFAALPGAALSARPPAMRQEPAPPVRDTRLPPVAATPAVPGTSLSRLPAAEPAVTARLQLYVADPKAIRLPDLEWVDAPAPDSDLDCGLLKPLATSVPAHVNAVGEGASTAGAGRPTVPRVEIEDIPFPARMALVAREQAETLRRQLQVDSRGLLLTAPSIVCPSGNQGSIFVGQERPFVTEQIELQSGKDGVPPVCQPVVTMVQEGLSMELLPVLVEHDGEQRIQIALSVSRIEVTGCETTGGPVSADGTPTEIQLPRVRRSTTGCSGAMSGGETMILQAGTKNGKGELENLLIFVECDRAGSPAPPEVPAERQGERVESSLPSPLRR